MVKENHTIVDTDLTLPTLIQSKLKGHSKSWSDLGLGYLRQTLKFKARKHSVKYEIVSERELKSTQTCSSCKSVTGPKGIEGLRVSSWICSECGKRHLRNQNSADNHRLTYHAQEPFRT